MGTFHRTNEKPTQLGFVQGPARILVAPITQAVPTQISDVIRISGVETNEVQSLSISGTPTGGTFTLSFNGATTAPIPYNAAAAAVQSALEALVTIGSGNVLCAGTALPTGPITITFQGLLAGTNVAQITGNSAGLTGGTTPTVNVTTTTPGSGLFDPVGSWFDLGGTKNGIAVGYNMTDEDYTIDQTTAIIATKPTSAEMFVQTNLVEVTTDNISVAWEGTAVSQNNTPTIPERMVQIGTPSSYTTRRLAVIHRRPSGLLRMHFIRFVNRGSQESTLTYAPTGEQQSIPMRFRALADSMVANDNAKFGFIIDQVG